MACRKRKMTAEQVRTELLDSSDSEEQDDEEVDSSDDDICGLSDSNDEEQSVDSDSDANADPTAWVNGENFQPTVHPFTGNSGLHVDKDNFEFVDFLIDVYFNIKTTRLVDFSQAFYRKLMRYDD